ncbi:DUF7006 family protein [Enterococcus innesii]|uniref:DUF7006 family protein n=1 Tax=Enterococcus innesii TaxID=2839759 RepID=UPI003984F44B
MLSEKIKEPNDYLSYSKEILTKSGVLTTYPKIAYYYQTLCQDFERNCYVQSKTIFDQLSILLSIDAQIQILLELTENTEKGLCEEFGMKEEEIIAMIKNDQKYYYRELTGSKANEDPRWCLIYLSED